MIEAYWKEPLITQYCGNAIEVLAALPEGIAQCVVTSPPYWGLRKYAGEQDLIWGNVDHCEHEWQEVHPAGYRSSDTNAGALQSIATQNRNDPTSNICLKCGCWRGAYGLEPSVEMYVDHTIEILRAIRRVLRKDGVVFWNVGDSYAGGKGQSGQPMSAAEQDMRYQSGESINRACHQMEMSTRPSNDLKALRDCNLKPKDLCLIPFRVALAAQADGWWVRSVIIWSKANPMPESVRDRPTESHEYILMLTKSAKYYCDQEAVREPQTGNAHSRGTAPGDAAYQEARGSYQGFSRPKSVLPSGRNIRTVWNINTQPFKGSHFATFPEELAKRCILAATSEKGNCSKCGKPWVRIVERTRTFQSGSGKAGHKPSGKWDDAQCAGSLEDDIRSGPCVSTQTLGWQPTCFCESSTEPALVLDPFSGSGTTGAVAKKLGRQAILIDTSEQYCDLAIERIAKVPPPLF